MMRKGLILLLAAVVLMGAACRRVEEPANGSDIVLTFRVGESATKAVTPGNGDVADGGGIYCTKVNDKVTPDLVIFIFNEDGTLKKRYPTDGELVESNYDSGHASTLSISFGSTSSDGWADGAYPVFALANIAGTGGNLTIPDLNSISDITDLANLQLGYSGTAPSLGTTDPRMPLSASGTLYVAKGLYNKYNGLLELEMLRCFAKVQLTFRNLTGNPLTLNECSVTFKDMNTQQAWLFPTDPDFVELGVVTGTKDSNYGDYTTVATDINSTNLTNIPSTDDLSTVNVDERERDAFAAPLLFFPSIAPKQNVPSAGNRYLCDISFKVGTATTAKTFTNLPIHDAYTQDILELKRNQYLQILTTISNGTDVSFNFFVKDWDPHQETVIFH